MTKALSEEELLSAALNVLRDAIDEAEFQQTQKELEYVRFVAQRVAAQQAKVHGGPEAKVANVRFNDSRRVVIEYEMEYVGGLTRATT